jgi:hypothetical protein
MAINFIAKIKENGIENIIKNIDSNFNKMEWNPKYVSYFIFVMETNLNFIIEIMGGSHIDEDAVFGSTGGAHAGLMAALWGPGINIAIILSFYSYRKWWGILHGIYGAFTCIYTLATSLPILFYTGIIPKDSNQDLKYSAPTLNLHYLVEIACLLVVLI